MLLGVPVGVCRPAPKANGADLVPMVDGQASMIVLAKEFGDINITTANT